MKLTFLGAAREVTGSSYLVETGKVRFLVDCGMFQGGQEAAQNVSNPRRIGYCRGICGNDKKGTPLAKCNDVGKS